MTTFVLKTNQFEVSRAEMPGAIKKLVYDAKKNRKNRVYYSDYFVIGDLRKSGLVQIEEKSRFDRVILDKSVNESVQYFGFDQQGSHFHLRVFILSLYPQFGEVSAEDESQFRLAKVDFELVDQGKKFRYTYSNEQLIDYDKKRAASEQHECKNVLKIGSLSVETVLPFSLSRILFNGLLKRTSLDDSKPDAELIATRLTISTHPTCDKFDYKYKFKPDYLSRRISECKLLRNGNYNQLQQVAAGEQLLAIALENRIDQTLMFQVKLEPLESPAEVTNSVMWGAKVKRFLEDTPSELSGSKTSGKLGKTRENLFIWSECGLQINLSRPKEEPNLVYGMIHNAYEYASYLYDAKYLNPSAKGSSFDQLDAFSSLAPGSQLSLRGFKKKEYSVEVIEARGSDGLIKVSVNGFEGWALACDTSDLADDLRLAQRHLWTLRLHQPELSTLVDWSPLANEKLLGGKGSSLVELHKLASSGQFSHLEAQVSVPQGLVVTCLAYDLWLNSNPLIRSSIEKLDCVRRSLASRSVHLNPMSERHLSLAQSQQILKDQCRGTNLALNSCPLPEELREHLLSNLLNQFTEEQLGVGERLVDAGSEAKVFAIRSSAVGEDSLETSAAGQMRTILDARGFQAICSGIVDCWSSQFQLEALAYKSQNGLPLNLPMAVVVQELAPCQVAGVAACCNPLTGNKRELEILANRGLGEGVVSGKETETTRVRTDHLQWAPNGEWPTEYLANERFTDQCITRLASDGNSTPCLTNKQVIALSNLLIKLRMVSDIKEREIEWGMTFDDGNKSQTSDSSSSSSGTTEPEPQFRIHLLQSRPLTHLSRLSSREVDHELDNGYSSPMDLISRANLGEVMPGALCPMTFSFFLSVCNTQVRGKPLEVNHTMKTFTANSFGAFGQVANMVLTYSDIIKRFPILTEEEMDSKDKAMRLMIGTVANTNGENQRRLRELNREKSLPVGELKREDLLTLLWLDCGGLKLSNKLSMRQMRNEPLEDDLCPIEQLAERFDNLQKVDDSKDKRDTFESLEAKVKADSRKLYERLIRRPEPLGAAWLNHMRGTLLSMAFNIICMQLLSKSKDTYPDGLISGELLNDFSLLIRGGPKTESGDISALLDRLVVELETAGQLESARQLDESHLYKLLSGDGAKLTKFGRLYREFMQKNGHRAFKEFDFATPTWADDPSYIIKSLALRLKTLPVSKETDGGKREVAKLLKRELEAEEHEAQINKILDKVTSGRMILARYALPRARNAVVRRENTKSQLIWAIQKYRRAFRHLGGLLCLLGRVPSADLVYQLTIEELEELVYSEQSGGLGRLLYKARRRQQRARVLNRIAFPEPTLNFEQMVELVQQVTGEIQPKAQPQNGDQLNGDAENSVRGMTSCAGCVTGRACVVNSLEDMDQIEPNDILITYSIDISWSVYFFTLSGIVTEIGGIVSHGAVVAREYGIPTLCTAVGACSKFKTGQTVTLDANQGVCYLSTSALNNQVGEGANGAQAP